jgi:hypothetical protein
MWAAAATNRTCTCVGLCFVLPVEAQTPPEVAANLKPAPLGVETNDRGGRQSDPLPSADGLMSYTRPDMSPHK